MAVASVTGCQRRNPETAFFPDVDGTDQIGQTLDRGKHILESNNDARSIKQPLCRGGRVWWLFDEGASP